MKGARRSKTDAPVSAPQGSTDPYRRMGLKISYAPIGRNLVVLVQPALPLAVAPVEFAARAVGGGLAQLFVGNIELVGLQRGVVMQCVPRQRMVFLPHAEEAAEFHHRVGDL